MADLDKFIEQLYEGKLLSEKEVKKICELVSFKQFIFRVNNILQQFQMYY